MRRGLASLVSASAGLRRAPPLACTSPASSTRRERRREISTASVSGLTTHGAPVAIHNPSGKHRVVVTKALPGTRYLEVLIRAGCRVEIATSPSPVLSKDELSALVGDKCDGVIGQLTENWDDEALKGLAKAGAKAFSTYAVGYNNVDVKAATAHGVAVGNTPGVLTETTAELAAALALAAARRVCESDAFTRRGEYEGWLPTLFVGQLLQRKTVGIIGAGRIGQAFAKMMCEGHKMDLVYFDLFPQPRLEKYFAEYSEFLRSQGDEGVKVERLGCVEEVLRRADLVSLHCALDESTRHLMDAERLALMKPGATLVNAARGEVVDEAALVAHLRANADFRAGLDVYEREPRLAEGLAECSNAVLCPHIASASSYTRESMATIAAANVAGRLRDQPVWRTPDVVAPYVQAETVDDMPLASPSIVNAEELGIPRCER